MSKSDRPPVITVPAFRQVRPQAKRPSLNSLKKPSLRPGFIKEEQTGACIVCGGGIVESLNSIEETSGRHSMTNTGYHCSTCGLKYQFPPSSKVRRK